MTITIIGSGNVATQLGLALKNNGFQILEVVGRNPKSALLLGKKLDAKASSNLFEINKTSDLYFIAVNDDQISHVAAELSVNGIIVHTSGSVDLSVLSGKNQTGVFYPLQTISKDKLLDFKQVPICIEASNIATYEILHKIATSLSDKVIKINSEQRKTIHLAAVFVNNFTNHLYHIADEILKENNIPFELLKSLILETAKKVQHISPFESQTGPAIRNDKNVIDNHLKLLKNNESYCNLYKFVSESIITTYGTK